MDFPRGWTLNNVQLATGSAAQVTVAATPGVVHVLDSVRAKLADINAGPGLLTFLIQVLTAAGTVEQAIIAAQIPGADEVDLTSLEIASAPGGSIVVAFNGATSAGVFQEITIQGHDI